ncbi:MAG: DCC1-like thiol-disulfide oxidoreductase family protein [Cyanobacteria bacterium P01_B01_bin.77]
MVASRLKSLERYCGLDLRSLALFRVGLALVICSDLLGRWDSLLTRSSAGLPGYWSIHGLSEAVGWQIGCFAIAILAALLMLFGYRTRWATLVSWGMLVSLHNYNSLLVHAVDDGLRTILFWAMFLPLGSSYSIDQALNTSPQLQPKRIFTGAIFGLILQLGVMIVVLIKAPSLASGVIVCLLGLLFIPSWLWKHWTAWTPKQLGLKIYYDADCGFCKKVVHLLRTFLVLPGRVPLQIAQSDPVIQTAMETHNSWVIVDWQGQHHYKWHGIAYVVSLSPIVWPLAHGLRWSPLMSVGTRIYETIANNRRFAGNFTKPFKFQAFTARSSNLLNLVALAMLLLVVGWNLHGMTSHGADGQLPGVALVHRITQPVKLLSPLLQITRLDHSWNLD